jgi:hypothetical protein
MSQPLSIGLLTDIAQLAIRHGASDAEVIGLASAEFSVEVRLGAVEKVHEANSQGIGLRVLHLGRQAFGSTSDTSPEAIEGLVSGTVTMARHTSVDPDAMLPAATELQHNPPDAVLASTCGFGDTSAYRPGRRPISPRRLRRRPFHSIRESSTLRALPAPPPLATLFASSAGFAGAYEGTTISLVTRSHCP